MVFREQIAYDGPVGWAIAVLVLAAALFQPWMSRRLKMGKYPLLGREYGSRSKRANMYFSRAAALFEEGYKRFRGQIYRVTTTDGTQPSQLDLHVLTA
jgi:hypothetical protein